MSVRAIKDAQLTSDTYVIIAGRYGDGQHDIECISDPMKFSDAKVVIRANLLSPSLAQYKDYRVVPLGESLLRKLNLIPLVNFEDMPPEEQTFDEHGIYPIVAKAPILAATPEVTQPVPEPIPAPIPMTEAELLKVTITKKIVRAKPYIPGSPITETNCIHELPEDKDVVRRVSRSGSPESKRPGTIVIVCTPSEKIHFEVSTKKVLHRFPRSDKPEYNVVTNATFLDDASNTVIAGFISEQVSHSIPGDTELVTIITDTTTIDWCIPQRCVTRKTVKASTQTELPLAATPEAVAAATVKVTKIDSRVYPHGTYTVKSTPEGFQLINRID
jgi:hypothetical protein